MPTSYTVREGILNGLRQAGRPLSRPELAGYYFSHSREKRAALQGELDAMVAGGELVVTGETVPRHYSDTGPHPIYGIRAGRPT